MYALAQRHALSGFVLNDGRGVRIEVEGEESALNAFEEAIRGEAPPLSKIERIRTQSLPSVGFQDFTIRRSTHEGKKRTWISPDTSVCPECLRELFDPKDRRFHYPFINCTHCGPRFTIVEDVPYDRDRTTMRSFEMCLSCRREYEDPANRRFHAQPNACPVCGPQVWLVDGGGRSDFEFRISDWRLEIGEPNPQSAIPNPQRSRPVEGRLDGDVFRNVGEVLRAGGGVL